MSSATTSTTVFTLCFNIQPTMRLPRPTDGTAGGVPGSPSASGTPWVVSLSLSMILILQIFLQHQPRRHFVDPVLFPAFFPLHPTGDERLMSKHRGITLVPGLYRDIHRGTQFPDELFNFHPFRANPAVGGIRHADDDERNCMFSYDVLKTGEESIIVRKRTDALRDDAQRIAFCNAHPLTPVIDTQYTSFPRIHALFVEPLGTFYTLHFPDLIEKPAQVIGVLDIQDKCSLEVGVL